MSCGACYFTHSLAYVRAHTHTRLRADTYTITRALSFISFSESAKVTRQRSKVKGLRIGVNIPYQYFPEHEKCPKSPLSVIVVIAHWPAQCQLAHRTAVVESM